MKILWAEPAIDDLRRLYNYIARDSELYASNFVQRVIHSVEKLSEFPRLGRKVPEADQDAIREVIYQGYRIIYRIQGELIEILTVLHGRRDLRLLTPPPWDVSE